MIKNKQIQNNRFKPKFHVKKGDTVMVVAGDEKGKQGEILKMITKDARALVQGLNLVKKHVKPNAQNPQGQIIEKEAPIHVSNLMLIVNGKPSRKSKVSEAKAAAKPEKKSTKKKA